ncbi:MAG: hypothetical protein OEU36_17865 [Gammaproteobacteria bacterium]|nr:hypothetical protein [Gammaproteobacteria bacterium]
MVFALVYLTLLLLPGYALVRICGYDRPRFLFTIALSIIFAVLAMLVAKLLQANTQSYVFLWGSLFSLVAVIWVVQEARRSVAFSIRGMLAGITFSTWTAIVLGICVAGYAYWAGPYVEIPSDAIWHLAHIREAYEDIVARNGLDYYNFPLLFSKIQQHWYMLVGQTIWISGLEVDEALPWISAVNSVLIVIAFYFFSAEVLRPVVKQERTLSAMAAGASLLFVFHFGLSVFSFFRYYTLGPVYLNYVIYMAALLSLWRYLAGTAIIDRWLLFAVIAAIVMTMLHKQETLFLLTMGGTITLIYAWRIVRKQQVTEFSAHGKILLIAGLVAFGYLAIHAYLYVSVVRHNPLSQGVMTDIGALLPFLHNLYILKPDYQFYQVLTVWGVLVYILYFLSGRELRKSPVIAAGMIVPVLTVFNPVFTDLFLRISWPELLWRVTFVVPLEIAGGYFLVRSIQSSLSGSVLNRGRSAMVAVLLVITLFPFEGRFFINKFSKFEMLKPVSASNDARYWSELFSRLNTMEDSLVLTDPVTGYSTNAYTNHNYPAHKFFGGGMLDLRKPRYTRSDFNNYRGWLLVVNRKDGAHSKTGQSGKHWGQNIMKTSLSYGDAFLHFVSENPDFFRTLWSGEDQVIYRIARR